MVAFPFASMARLLLVVCLLFASRAVCAQSAAAPLPEIDEAGLRRASDAVVGVRALALENARSNEALGRLREGSGIVISDRGLVLTIGYLVLEADQVLLLLDDGRMLPARVVGLDIATGFGLVQSLVPLPIAAAPLGRASNIELADPLVVISGGEEAAVSQAKLAARRPFSGYWEYRIEEALFTIPPRTDQSGAGLFNLRGQLVGVGSLLVADALGAGPPGLPGNMFVPIDLLLPILDELQRTGSSHLSRRAWMGLNCMENEGGVRVVNVAADSPAQAAGVRAGDRIVRIDDKPVATLDDLWLTLWTGGAAEREVRLDVHRGNALQTLKLHTVDRTTTFKRAEGT